MNRSAKPTVSRHNIHSGAKTSSDGPVSDHLSVKGQGGMDSKSDHPSVRKRKPLSSLTNTMPSPKQHKALTSTEHKPCPQTVDRPLSQSNTASGLDDVGPAPTVLGAENEYIIVGPQKQMEVLRSKDTLGGDNLTNTDEAQTKKMMPEIVKGDQMTLKPLVETVEIFDQDQFSPSEDGSSSANSSLSSYSAESPKFELAVQESEPAAAKCTTAGNSLLNNS